MCNQQNTKGETQKFMHEEAGHLDQHFRNDNRSKKRIEGKAPLQLSHQALLSFARAAIIRNQAECGFGDRTLEKKNLTKVFDSCEIGIVRANRSGIVLPAAQLPCIQARLPGSHQYRAYFYTDDIPSPLKGKFNPLYSGQLPVRRRLR